MFEQLLIFAKNKCHNYDLMFHLSSLLPLRSVKSIFILKYILRNKTAMKGCALISGYGKRELAKRKGSSLGWDERSRMPTDGRNHVFILKNRTVP